MTTIDDIDAQKNAAIGILDQKLYDAANQKNAVGLTDAQQAQLDRIMDDLMAQRSSVVLQAYEAAQNSTEMAAALHALTTAAAEMKTVAARMTTLTEYVSNVASLGNATGKIVAALKGL